MVVLLAGSINIIHYTLPTNPGVFTQENEGQIVTSVCKSYFWICEVLHVDLFDLSFEDDDAS